MSLTNVKDLDLLICKKLNIKDLNSFSRVNKHYNKIFNDSSLWMNKILELNINKEYFCKDLTKEYYIELYEALKNKNFVKIIYYSILKNRCDIVSLIFKKRNLNPNFSFVFKNFRNLRLKDCYYAEEKDNNVPFEYSPINFSIKKGYYPMWNFFHSNYKLEINSEIYIVSIVANNLNIFKDILSYNVFIEHWVLHFSLLSLDLKTTKLLLGKIEEEEIYNMLNFMNIDFKDEYMKWIEFYNEAFAEVLKFIDIEYLKRITRNNQDFTKLINFYT